MNQTRINDQNPLLIVGAREAAFPAELPPPVPRSPWYWWGMILVCICGGGIQMIHVMRCRLAAAAWRTVTGKTITVTTNWGNTADTPTIATAKGWTVTG